MTKREEFNTISKFSLSGPLKRNDRRRFFYLLCRSTAYLAAACVYWRFLGEQLNPLIRPLMDALKKETDSLIQVGEIRGSENVLFNFFFRLERRGRGDR